MIKVPWVWEFCQRLLHSAWRAACAIAIVGALTLPAVLPAYAEGSRNLYPNGAIGNRADHEWRTSSYGPIGPPDSTLRRRTLFKVFANQNEFILAGSSAVGVGAGDVLIYDPGIVTGAVGKENVVLASASYSCAAQRTATGNAVQGQITGRAAELAGPDTIVNPINATPGGAVLNGYVPCFYQAPVTGIYDVVISGPSGFASNAQGNPTGDVALTSPNNFNATQMTNVSAWDVTVRSALTSTADLNGRLFTYYLNLFAGANGRLLYSTIYVVTTDGYQYQTDLNAMDPNGFLLYGNQIGFADAFDQSPLYHDVLATGAGNLDQLTQLQGGVDMAAPLYPVFFNPPDAAALLALGIPLTPTAPSVSAFAFDGSVGGNTSLIGTGGTFSYTSNIGGVYEIIISRDGVDFDPTNPLNRVMRGVRGPGTNTATWDGLDNSGSPFPVGVNYAVHANVHAGEYHFPLIDSENSTLGGPTYTLLNPPGGVCPLAFGCSAGFYDDRGYRTLNGSIVGTVGAVLCGLQPPGVANGVSGFDSSGTQRAYGTGGGNAAPCAGTFGDKKGLDLWTFFPSNNSVTFVNIVNAIPTPTDTPTATSTPTPTPTNTPGPGATVAPSSTPPPGGTLGPSPTPRPGLPAATAVSRSQLQSTPTPKPSAIPGTGFGPGLGELLVILTLWLLAALTPWIGWQMIRRTKRRM
jgi:hypothetical protein